MYDATRLLVACTGASPTCHTPHFVCDILTALLADDATTTLRRVGCEAEFLVRGFPVVVRVVESTRGTVAVRCEDNKFVIAYCLRTARVPVAVNKEPTLPRLTTAYGEGKVAPSIPDGGGVQWEDVVYLEASPVVESIRLLLP